MSYLSAGRKANSRVFLRQAPRELMDKFIEKFGTVICRKLLNGCELTTDDGQKYFKENDLLNKTCAPCVQSVVEIIENIMR